MSLGQRETDELYMRRCLQLAGGGGHRVSPNPMVGAVVVCGGRIIGEGYHRVYGGPHAEVNALASVRERGLLGESTVYVSLEPCAHYGKTPPCADLLIREGVRRVVVGCPDPFGQVNGQGIERLRAAGVEVRVGVLEGECRWLNRRFFTRHSLGRPHITLKWAQSSDGFIAATPGGRPATTRISTPLTQAISHKLRAETDAILVGRLTAETDNPSLTTRLWAGPSPLRLVVDPRGALPRGLHVFDGRVPTRVYVVGSQTLPYPEGVTVVSVGTREGMVEAILEDVKGLGLNSLMVEGGSTTHQAFVDRGLWDEAHIETSPLTLSHGVPAPHLRNASLHDSHWVDGHLIETYIKA